MVVRWYGGVGWEVCCGVGLKGRRSQVGGLRSGNGCQSNLLTRQNKTQPKREILENGENPEIRKIQNNNKHVLDFLYFVLDFLHFVHFCLFVVLYFENFWIL